MPELRQEYLDILEKREWSVSGYTDDGRVELEWWSPAGEDFLVCVNVENFPDEILDYSDDFDPDEHIEMWVEARANGRQDVPGARRLAKDAEDIQKELDELAFELQEAERKLWLAAAADDKLVKFAGTGDLKAASGVKLAGGTNVTSANGDVTAFVDKMEGIKFNTLCFPVTDDTLQTAVRTKIKYMRENMGKGVNAVLPDAKSPDHEGIINVTNSVVVDGVELTHAEACAFVAGITASASCIKSNTYEVYNGATGIVDPKDNEAAIAAIKNGEMFFSYSEAGNVIIEYDINSLVSFKKPKDKTYSKNRVIRTLDAIQETIQNNFPPNKYDNSPTGYAVMKGIGQTILKQYEDMGAIKNVDYDADFKIDESLSSGDEVYFIVAIQPVDSAEKLFFTVKTR